jgi:hypothetical protein
VGLALLGPSQLELIAALGPLLIAVRRLWDQLMGPRARVAHPLVRAALEAGDALAGLVPFLLAGLAVAVTRIGPVLEPLSLQFILLANLGRTMFDLFWFIVMDAVTRLAETLTGQHGVWAVISGVFAALNSSFSHTGGWLGETWTSLVKLMVASKAVVDAALSGWWLAAEPQIRALTVENPMIGMMKTFAEQLGIVADAWKHSARPAKASGPGVGTIALALLMAKPLPGAPSKSGLPFPTAPTVPPFPITGSPAAAISGTARTMIAIDELLPGAIPNPISLDEASSAALEAARRPGGGVFAGRAAALRRSITPAERARREQAQRDLEAYMAIAQRLASPAVAQQLPRLDSILAQLHDAITTERTAAHLPVRQLDDRPVLRPQIRTLLIRVAPGGDRAAADAWTRLLRDRLVANPTTAPAGA